MSNTGATVDELGRRRRARAAQTTDLAAFMVAATRALRRLEHPGARLRLSYTKVAEFQHRGAVHFHALVRFDGRDPDDPTAILTPNPGVRAGARRAPAPRSRPNTVQLVLGHEKSSTTRDLYTRRTDDAGRILDALDDREDGGGDDDPGEGAAGVGAPR